MIRIDLTTSSVSVEGDGRDENFITVRAMMQGGILAGAKNLDTGEVIEESIRTRSGTRMLFEYDIKVSGTYELKSGNRDSQQQRRILLRVEFRDHDIVRLTVLADSTSCQWVIEDTPHRFTTGETLLFDLLPSACSIGESDLNGVNLHRATAWELLLADDALDSV